MKTLMRRKDLLIMQIIIALKLLAELHGVSLAAGYVQ